MKILFLSQYFPPEMGAPSARIYELAKYWVKLGHTVTIITGFPNHPTGKLVDSYRGMIFKKEVVDGINVIRTWVYATPNKGFLKRILNYISFMISSLLLGTLPAKECDVVIATSPQFFTAVAGYLMSVLKRKPFIFELRDFWPQSIVELGVLKNKFIISILTSIEMFLYHRAEKIIGVAESTKKILIDRGIEPGKIEIIPNGIDPNLFNREITSANIIREKYNFNGKYVVSYIGTHGLSHALDSVLECARLMSSDDNIVYMFVGEGAEKDNLIKKRDEFNLKNVIFIDQQAKSLIPEYYKASDICLVTLRDLEIFKKVLPSKIFEIMACGRPIIGAIKGEARQLIEKSGSGIVVEPENPKQLLEAIRYLIKNRLKMKELGRNGKSFVFKYYLRNKLASKYLEIIQEVIKDNAQ